MAKRVFITTDRIGRGDDDLGRALMKNFLYSLARNADKPASIILMNGGVRLACTGSDSIDDLALLTEAEVAVKVCGTCLDFLGIKDQLAVGEIGTMPDSVAALLSSEIVTIA